MAKYKLIQVFDYFNGGASIRRLKSEEDYILWCGAYAPEGVILRCKTDEENAMLINLRDRGLVEEYHGFITALDEDNEEFSIMVSWRFTEAGWEKFEEELALLALSQ